MPYCNQCGEEIDIRYVNGRLTPIHPSGGCGFHYDIRDHYQSHGSDSRCWPTTCNECKNKVFFIRHNGGSVWIDPPLGPPWQKHECFYKHQPSGSKRTLIEDTHLGRTVGPNMRIAVVTRTEVHPIGLETILHLEFADGSQERVVVAGTLDFAGEMVFVDEDKNHIRFWKGRDAYAYTRQE